MNDTTITLSRKQEVAVIDEFWMVTFNGIPYPSATAEDIYNWISIRYNCRISRPTAMDSIIMKFIHEKDLMFFLLNHPPS